MTTTTTTTATAPRLSQPSLRRSLHERDILAAISDSATMDDLLRCPKWTVDDVSSTLQRYGLVVGDDGRITRKRTVDDLLYLAKHAASPPVKTAAKKAAKQLEALQEAINEHRADLMEGEEKARQRDAVEQWIQWLTDALGEARAEKRRLRARSPKGA